MPRISVDPTACLPPEDNGVVSAKVSPQAGGTLGRRARGVAADNRVRVRVHARDVSLAVTDPGASSIQNILDGRVESIGDDEHPGLLLVRVQVGSSLLLARLTRRSAAQLGIAPGLPVSVQIKSVALME